ncbi:hypothetical protein COEREDRAFT_80395 [Coemansia reversa NRRL 1564]|uniref:GSKIP domain-containing protein n=1 Tax=Coemansia reversa (strain ATCC 12441 / NRRL 1564) TaxID=763665 RepID=A0A2G5BFD4_COERN|nr:hypothetical protein COEREDRAFT_80395 [Coemansia reversa NRRL 1564]|eukprot:PIA17736.1 hypothetical protein COEREDRAFT_80395 [Coemansia reversa NRRL 1564]
MPNFRTKKGLLEEFSTELRDHAYGIKSYTTPVVFVEQPLKAESVVILLSGTKVVVALDTSGYTARSSTNSSSVVSGTPLDKHAKKPFETLTALLLALSPEFNQAMHNLISSRLLALQETKMNQS